MLPHAPRAVVTGGASGLGRALCLELAGRRARLLIADLDEAGASETARLAREAGGEAETLRCDVAEAGDVERLAAESEARLGGVDLLVNNAGVAVGGPVGTVPLEDWRWITGINLWGVVYGCHYFVPKMRERNRGHVLNVASAAGLLSAPMMGPYNVTKAGVVALSETLSAELAGTGVGVSVLCPTFFTTNIARSSRAFGGASAESVEKLMSRARVQAPDVARAAIDAVAKGSLYVLPHADGRWFWRLKRLAPERYATKLLPKALALTGILGKKRR